MTMFETMPRGPFTVADLASFPDDGRYEIIDGLLLVSPSPSLRHQIAAGHLLHALRASDAHGTRAILAPFDVQIDHDTVLQPDVMVVRPEHLERYERAGVPHYWVVDPEVPRVMAWELRDGEYVTVADVRSDETWDAPSPFDVTLVPSALVR